MGKRCEFVVFLDRDGTLIRRKPGGYLRLPEEVVWKEGVVEALRGLYERGGCLVVVSNQQGVAKGVVTWREVSAIHRAMAEYLRRHGVRVCAFLFCPHREGTCVCRKPCPGMIYRFYRLFPALRELPAVLIGDSWRDWLLAVSLRIPFIHCVGEDAEARWIPGVRRFERWGELDWGWFLSAAKTRLPQRS